MSSIRWVPSAGAEGGRDAELLAACYWNSLALAVEHNLSSIAFPSISTGAYGYPREEAAAVSSKAIEDFLTADKILKEVRLVFYSLGDATIVSAEQCVHERRLIVQGLSLPYHRLIWGRSKGPEEL